MSAPCADVVIVGAGAAGLMCAIEAGKCGRSVIVLDHASRPAEKIRISGGGRCNFTNVHTSPENFISRNPRFAISALARYTPRDFLALVERHGIAYHEKKLGQLFCDSSSQHIIQMLLEECRQAGVQLLLRTEIQEIQKPASRFFVQTHKGTFDCDSLVIASGGLSIPKMGATGFGYRIAQQFGLAIVPTSAGLVPITLTESDLRSWSKLAGLSVQAQVKCGSSCFAEGLLFTHRGLSGPAILQISSYWSASEQLAINLAPAYDVAALLREARRNGSRQEVVNFISSIVPRRLAQSLGEMYPANNASNRLSELSNASLEQLGGALNDWTLSPGGTEGYRTAEVTLGGVSTAELDSKTMMSRKVAGLFFIGEVVDVTGQLGGFNFQWAWASGYVAGQYA